MSGFIVVFGFSIAYSLATAVFGGFTPAPITTMVFGILGSVRAPVEVTTVFSSTVTPGRDEASEPEAMTMFFASFLLATKRI